MPTASISPLKTGKRGSASTADPAPEPTAETPVDAPAVEQPPAAPPADDIKEVAPGDGLTWTARSAVFQSQVDGRVKCELIAYGPGDYYRDSLPEQRAVLVDAIMAQLKVAPCLERMTAMARQLDLARQREMKANASLKALEDERASLLASPPPDLGARILDLEGRKADALKEHKAAHTAVSILGDEVGRLRIAAREEMVHLGRALADEQRAAVVKQFDAALQDLVRRERFALRHLGMLSKLQDARELRAAAEQVVNALTRG